MRTKGAGTDENVGDDEGSNEANKEDNSSCGSLNNLKNGARTLHQGIPATFLRSNDGATALVTDHGAHLLSWIPAGGEEALFLSTASRYGEGAAIRGGVPIIFPQFAEQGSGRRHGFARISTWQSVTAELGANGAALASWRLQGSFENAPDDGSGGSYCLTFDIRLAGDTIECGLTIENLSAVTWQCNAALHTYLKLNALTASVINGLGNVAYVDQTIPDKPIITDQASLLTFDAEIDRIYPNAPSYVQLQEPGRDVIVEQTGFHDTVVWNPGAEKAAALNDLQKEGFLHFVCIEAAAITKSISLPPATRWRGVQRLRVLTRRE